MLSVAVFYPDGVGKIRGGVTVRNSAAMKKAETSTGQLLYRSCPVGGCPQVKIIQLGRRGGLLRRLFPAFLHGIIVGQIFPSSVSGSGAVQRPMVL